MTFFAYCLKCDICDAALSMYFYDIYAHISLHLLLGSFVSTDGWYIHSFYELWAELSVTSQKYIFHYITCFFLNNWPWKLDCICVYFLEHLGETTEMDCSYLDFQKRVTGYAIPQNP